MITEPVRCTHVLHPAPLVTCLPAVVRNCAVKIDHLTAEVALRAVSPSAGSRRRCPSPRCTDRAAHGRQADEHFLSVAFVAFLRV